MPMYRLENGHRVPLSAAEEAEHLADKDADSAERIAERRDRMLEAIEDRVIRRAARNYLRTATDASLRTLYTDTKTAINSATDMAALKAINISLATG